MFYKKRRNLGNDLSKLSPTKNVTLYSKFELISSKSAFSVVIDWVPKLKRLRVLVKMSWKLENDSTEYPCENLTQAIDLKNYLVAEKIRVFKQRGREN